MNRCSKSIALVLIGSPLILAGCSSRDEERNGPAGTYGGGGAYYYGGGVRPGARSGVTGTAPASPRGGFGGFGRIGGFGGFGG